MTVYGYARVSTEEQAASDRSSLEDQVRRIEGAAMIRGASVTRVFLDPGVSGAVPLSERPGGRELLACVAASPGCVVIASKMDRMFRSASDALNTVERLQKAGVSLVLVDMGTESVTENGASKMFFTMLAGFAEFERYRIAERVKDGKAGKRARGGATGGYAPYGYRVVGVGREAALEVDETEQRMLAYVERHREYGPTRIAAMLEEVGYRTRIGTSFTKQQVARLLTQQVARLLTAPSTGRSVRA